VPTANKAVEPKSIEEVFAALRSDTGVSAQTFNRYLKAVEPKSIEEVFAALRSDTGVSAQTFNRYLLHCWKCSKIIRRPHNCPTPFIDLTLEEDEDGVVDTSEPDVEIELVIPIE
jgi:hypothetical protein